MSAAHFEFRTKTTHTQIHPKVSFSNRRFHCNGYQVALGRKPKSCRVVQALMNDPCMSATRSRLMSLLFGDVSESQSPSSLWIQSQSLTRLMCRLRSEFEAKFCDAVPRGTVWFYYDNKSHEWVLYKLPSECADGKLRA